MQVTPGLRVSHLLSRSPCQAEEELRTNKADYADGHKEEGRGRGRPLSMTLRKESAEWEGLPQVRVEDLMSDISRQSQASAKQGFWAEVHVHLGPELHLQKSVCEACAP